MTENIQDKLYERYPQIIGETLWEISCGDGWFNIIDNLCRCITQHLEYNSKINEKNDIEVTVIQIKEKFGTLRFYINGGDNTVDTLISFAELMSGCTCEVCGSPGKIRRGGWLRTLCDTHSKERDY